MPIAFYPTPWSSLVVRGADSASWLNGIITCDVVGLRSGNVAWGSLLTKQGKVSADLLVVRKDDELVIGVCGGDAEATLTSLDGYLVMEDAEIEESSLCWVLFDADSSELASHLPGVSLHTWSDASVSIATLSVEQIEQLKANAALELVDSGWWETKRISYGVPALGTEYTEKDNLHAAGLEKKTVSWSKGCYLGQEVVCMQEMRGKVKSRLVHVELVAGPQVAPGAVLVAGGEEVGTLASAAGGHGIARVSAPHYESGATLRSNDSELRVV